MRLTELVNGYHDFQHILLAAAEDSLVDRDIAPSVRFTAVSA
jgi:hypothetical protein